MEIDNGSLRRLPDGAELSDLFRTYPVGVRELLAYHDRVLRHLPPLTVGERELIAAVVSRTRAPSSIRQADRDAVYAAGWSEEALYYAVLTCALFNGVNRIVDGMGIATSPEIQAGVSEILCESRLH